ncbi:MAG: cyclase family protein [Alphaproteobacteria bacterium]|nr:cyclase family protein [Alphaproteobacteria bacterium]
MGRRLIDISIPLEAGVKSDPPWALPKIAYLDHHQTASGIAEYFAVPVSALPEGEYAAIERVEISTHNGTHLDAPYHYFSRMNERLKPGGEPAMRIDAVPLDWCWQPGVKLDFRHFADGYVATPKDVEMELARIGHTLKPLEIVLVNTAAGMRYGQDDYVDRGCGMGFDATIWLLERGIRLVGIDGWSWDAPFSHTKRKVAETGNAKLIWEGHRAGREIGYCHLEKLHNLESLPAKGFEVICFPVKVKGGSAGWTRAVAALND